jgi:hypothetical protein
MKWGVHLKFWILVTLVMVLAVPAIVSVQSGLARISREVDMTRTVFGDDMTEHIVGRAKTVYSKAFVESGFIADLNKTHFSEEDYRKAHAFSGGMRHFGAITNSYFGSMVINLYGMMIRLYIIGHWMLFVGPFLVACVVDGYMTRAKKLAEFAYQNPSAFSLSSHALLWIIFFPIMYLVAPIPVTPLFVPIWALVMALPVAVMLSNSQRIFGS